MALGYFGGFRGPRLRLTFEAIEPWCRQGKTEGDGTALWVRVGVENLGAGPARGCLGRLISVTTNGALRPDVDPVQLRWAGVPRSRAFDPMDLRRDQREYLNVLCLADGSRWRLVTFEEARDRRGARAALGPPRDPSPPSSQTWRRPGAVPNPEFRLACRPPRR